MLDITLYATQAMALLAHALQSEPPERFDRHERRSLHRGALRLEGALNRAKRQPLDAELDALATALYELRAGALRDLMMQRLAAVHTISALWLGAEHLPLALQRQLLRLDLIDRADWREQAAAALCEHGIRVYPLAVTCLAPPRSPTGISGPYRGDRRGQDHRARTPRSNAQS